MTEGQTFRLFVLGEPVKAAKSGEPLVVMASFRGAHAVERVFVDAPWLKRQASNLEKLRSFLWNGGPRLEGTDLEMMGRHLFDRIVDAGVRDLFREAAGSSPALLPCEIYVESGAAAAWPWEYLYDPSKRRFLCDEFHPISRGVLTKTLAPGEAARRKGKLRVLLVLAMTRDPDSTAEEQRKAITDVFDAYLKNDQVALQVVEGVTPEALQKELVASDFDVVHFYGHAGFDEDRGEGYLLLEVGGKQSSVYAGVLARMLHGRGIQLVFLNACETGRVDPGGDPARSAVASALVDSGIPAVIATHLPMPERSSHLFAAHVYNSLVCGRSLGEAMRDGRLAMRFAEDSSFLDWGIPVLYTAEPNLVLFGRQPPPGGALATFDAAGREPLVKAMAEETKRGAPTLRAASQKPGGHRRPSRVRVALCDLDADVAFLPELVRSANAAQDYFEFGVAYLPIPGGAVVRGAKVERGNLSLAHVRRYLTKTPEWFGVDVVCCLTRHMIKAGAPGKEVEGLFAAGLYRNDRVVAVSTHDLREYAREAGVSFAYATFGLCLSIVVSSMNRIEFHDETVGCPFDYCDRRDDVVVALTKRKFDHEPCRAQIEDRAQLEAIDALIALDPRMHDSAPGQGGPASQRSPQRRARRHAVQPA